MKVSIEMSFCLTLRELLEQRVLQAHEIREQMQAILYSLMLPGKVFLQSITSDRNTNTKVAYKLNLSLKDIYYDELKQFHTKYMCVSANDLLSVELHTDSNCLGVASIPDAYKLMLDKRTIEVKVRGKDPADADITIKLNFQTVSSYRRKSPVKGKNDDQRRLEESPARSSVKDKESKAEQSFSYARHPNNETLGNTSRSSMLGTAKLQLEEDLVKQGAEGESLESLAQQREKILGELFGKFKRER